MTVDMHLSQKGGGRAPHLHACSRDDGSHAARMRLACVPRARLCCALMRLGPHKAWRTAGLSRGLSCVCARFQLHVRSDGLVSFT